MAKRRRTTTKDIEQWSVPNEEEPRDTLVNRFAKMSGEEKKTTTTAFILMFPCLILAGMAVYYAPTIGSMLAIALAIYQFLMLKQFIVDYYKKKE